eukprot:32785-Chlamydomonas_euryale.AAC.1
MWPSKVGERVVIAKRGWAADSNKRKFGIQSVDARSHRRCRGLQRCGRVCRFADDKVTPSTTCKCQP